MASMGWYTVEEEQQDKIDKKIGEFNNYLDQLENNNQLVIFLIIQSFIKYDLISNKF